MQKMSFDERLIDAELLHNLPAFKESADSGPSTHACPFRPFLRIEFMA